MSTPHRPLSRRRFLQNSAALAASAAVTTTLPTSTAVAATNAGASDFVSNWQNCPDRVWLGPEFWSNPLQDWQVAHGRIECTNAAADRNVHVLTRSLAARDGQFSLRVRLGRTDGSTLGKGTGSAGFRFGIRGSMPDYRNPLIFGRGVDAGITANGALFIGSVTDGRAGAVPLNTDEIELQLTGETAGRQCRITLTVLDARGQRLGSLEKEIPGERCAGGLALVNNFTASGGTGGGGGAGKAKKANQSAKKAGGGGSPGGLGTFWFADWRIGGSQVDANPERAFGPLLFSQYTLSGGTMKLSVQLPPIGAGDAQSVRLQLKTSSDWKDAGESPIHPEARLAAFRVDHWDATREVPYRLVYPLKFRDGKTEEHQWTGTIRRDPVDQPELSVADISCNIHEAFPNDDYVAKVGKLNPDFIAFVGDQFYESSGGYGIIRTPTDKAMIDYLRKWYLHGWTWREFMRDRPSISLPDDHDVYQGNLWGEGGHINPKGQASQESGGYTMPHEWVNLVHLTQTAHHPDPHDPRLHDGVSQYYGPLVYGRVSFALLADRQYKSGPEGKVPPTGGRGDHESNPNFDPKTADVPGLTLLGDEQEKWLASWLRDWRGAEMKAIISQTIFTSFPTTHGGAREVLRADYDSNGWPQTARNRAVREIRKVFAFHISGDQHIPGLVHYGVDAHRDASVAFAGPPINTGYPRWFEPDKAPWTKPKQAGLTGDFTDSYGHPMTVLAVKNGAVAPQRDNVLHYMDEKSSGFGMVRFDKRRRKIRIECWPYLADFSDASAQMPGWPVEIDMLDNYARQPAGHLPPLKIAGVAQPLIEVIDQTSGEMIYALRVPTPEFRPHVFGPGKHIVKVSDPETGKSTELRDLTATADEAKPVSVQV